MFLKNQTFKNIIKLANSHGLAHDEPLFHLLIIVFNNPLKNEAVLTASFLNFLKKTQSYKKSISYR